MTTTNDTGATLNVRGIPTEAVERIKRAATLRGLTIGQYLDRLSQLHAVARQHADNGNASLQAELQALGLETVQE